MRLNRIHVNYSYILLWLLILHIRSISLSGKINIFPNQVNYSNTMKALCHDIRAIFSKLVSRDITTPTRQPLIENSVWDFNLVGTIMPHVTLIYYN